MGHQPHHQVGDLRRHVGGRAHHGALDGERRVVVLGRPGQPKFDDPNPSQRSVQENVFRFHVTMDEAAGMNGRQAGRDLAAGGRGEPGWNTSVSVSGDRGGMGLDVRRADHEGAEGVSPQESARLFDLDRLALMPGQASQQSGGQPAKPSAGSEDQVQLLQRDPRGLQHWRFGARLRGADRGVDQLLRTLDEVERSPGWVDERAGHFDEMGGPRPRRGRSACCRAARTGRQRSSRAGPRRRRRGRRPTARCDHGWLPIRSVSRPTPR